MKRKTVLILFIFIILTACSSKPECTGTYTKDSYTVQLNSDGTFIADNAVKFTGEYEISGEKVKFHVKKMGDSNFDTVRDGKLIGNTLTGPDGFDYTKK